MNNSGDAKTSFQMLLLNQQHIHENLKFADQKASGLIALNAALIGAIYPLARPHNQLSIWVGVFAFAMIAGIACSLCVIYPRGHRRRCEQGKQGIVDADRICQHPSMEAYASACANISDEELLKEARELIYHRSKINRKKYTFLRRSIWVSVVGWLGALILAGVVKWNGW
jgi:hypothetical protein